MEIWQQYEKISCEINQNVKLKVRQAVLFYLARSRTLQDPHSLHQAATAVLKESFPLSSPSEIDVLAFYLLCVIAAKEGVTQKIDSWSETSEMDLLKLQLFTDRRRKAMETLSNLLKKMSDTGLGIIKNLT